MRKRYGYRPQKREVPRYRINEWIRFPEVMVIDEQGNNLGVMAPQAALEIARERVLDLIEVSPNARPPVCKIMDFGKFQYQQSKQKQASQVKQKRTETKEIRLGIRTEEHDLNFKRSQVEKFLNKKNKVRIEMVLRGREKAHQDMARRALQEFVSQVTASHKVEEPIKRFPRGFDILIAPQ